VGGFVLLLPAGILLVSGLCGLNLPAALVHPLVLLVDLLAALLLNLATLVSAKVRCKNGIILGGIAIQVPRAHHAVRKQAAQCGRAGRGAATTACRVPIHQIITSSSLVMHLVGA
jgi:hypothetical protein